MYCALSAVSRRCQGFFGFLPPGFFFGSSLLMTLQPAAEKLAREITQSDFGGGSGAAFPAALETVADERAGQRQPLVPY